MKRLMRVALVAAVCALSVSWSLAAEQKLQVQQSDTIRDVLQKHAGKKVRLMLRSDEELIGTVEMVGDRVLHVSHLSGSEFFDAVVNIEDISAVIVHVRDR